MFTLNCRGKLLKADKPLVMGIINTTPDSFYEGSRFQGKDGVLRQAEKMLKEGAALLDIGGQSTRPSAGRIGPGEELGRVISAIESLHYNFPDALISIDTYYSQVAEEAVAAGACIINDIGGGTLDEQMIPLAGRLGVPYICMHIRGNPSNMNEYANYENVTRDVINYFIKKTAECREAGIKDLIIDPGFGFAKKASHNYELLRNLALFRIFEKPVLLGISRKRMIYRTLNGTAEEALNGTTALNMAGLMGGAGILRVHDVKEAVETIRLYEALEGKAERSL